MKPHSIDTKLMLALVDRMKNIVNGMFISYDASTNEIQEEVFSVTGSYTKTIPSSITSKVLVTGSTIEFTYGNSIVSNDFSVQPTFILFDTGYSIEVPNLSKLVLDDQFSFRCSDSTTTFVDVTTWQAGSTTKGIHPRIVVFPGEYSKTNRKTNNRRNITATFDLQIEFNFGNSTSRNNTSAITILEAVADIEDEIQRDPRFHSDLNVPNSCQVIDTQVTASIPYISESSSDLAGAFITLEMEYRTSLKNSRELQP